MINSTWQKYSHTFIEHYAIKVIHPLSNKCLLTIIIICLFDLWASVPVNSNGHLGTLPKILRDFYPKLGCHDTQHVLENKTNQVNNYIRLICMDGLTSYFSWSGSELQSG